MAVDVAIMCKCISSARLALRSSPHRLTNALIGTTQRRGFIAREMYEWETRAMKSSLSVTLELRANTRVPGAEFSKFSDEERNDTRDETSDRKKKTQPSVFLLFRVLINFLN